MAQDFYTTPEGFTLPRPLLLPDAREFAEVLEYLGEWDSATMSGYAGKAPTARPEPRWIGENEIGPYCTITTPMRRYRSIAVRATDAVIDVVTPRIVTPDDHLSFKVIEHPNNGRALVILDHNYIIGSHWLAYIDPLSIPAVPVRCYSDHNEDIRTKGSCDYCGSTEED